MNLCKAVLIFVISTLLCSCSKPLVSNISEYETLQRNVRYLISFEKESGFELSLYLKTDDFYTEKRHLAAEAKILFKDVANLICLRKGKKLGTINNNTYFVNADVDQKAVQLVNWVNYKN